MSATQKKIFWPVIITLALLSTGLFWASGRTKISAFAHSEHIASAPLPQATPTPQSNSATPRSDPQSRLARQPEVFKLNRSIGQRLTGHKPVMSVMIGTLIIGAEEHRVRILRRQDNGGESVEVTIGGNGAPLTWNAQEGARSHGGSPSDSERLLVERLTLDSPDQFVLAQLRGASYYTVAHNVRPEQATEDYTGPLWNIVRVGEPATGGVPGRWRLYYLNTVTGLIERIVSQEQEESVMAELSGWTTVNGEKVPSQITWSRQGQVFMKFALTNFSSGNQ